MARLVLYLVSWLCALAVTIVADPDGRTFFISSGLAIGLVIPLLDTLIVHSRYLKLAWYSLRTFRKRVRISASYLYRIKVDDQYLLIKGTRFDHYQPVGGVYKAYPSSSGRRNEMSVLDDNLLVPDEVSEGDLRVRVPGRNLLSFVKWFEDGRGREVDCWREFYEELIATEILPAEVFRFIKCDHLGRLYRPLRYSPWAESQELLIADLVELLPTADQLLALRRLKADCDSRILWSSEKQIRRLGAQDGSVSQDTRIAETAVWVVDGAAR